MIAEYNETCQLPVGGLFGIVDIDVYIESRRMYDNESSRQAKEAYNNIVLPQRSTQGSAGFDLVSPAKYLVGPNYYTTISTGLTSKLQHGWALLIIPRSGHGFKYGARLVNTIGLIDEDYEGQILVRMTSDIGYEINPGDRFAQAILVPYGTTPYDTHVYDPMRSERGAGGFGSTGQ